MTAMIAMSGGVDSSVAAYLSQREGLDCIGATAQMCGTDVLGEAYSQQSILDAKAVATRLGMDFHILDATCGGGFYPLLRRRSDTQPLHSMQQTY